MKVRKFVKEEWLAVSARWQLTSHALYYKIPYMKAHGFKQTMCKSFKIVKVILEIVSDETIFLRLRKQMECFELVWQWQ